MWKSQRNKKFIGELLQMEKEIGDEEINFRIVIENPDPNTIGVWLDRIKEFGLVIDSQNERSIDAHGKKADIENALAVEIQKDGEENNITSGPNLQIGPADTPVTAYIPRKPKFF